MLTQEVVTTLSSVEHNPDLAEDLFALPPEIDALLEKENEKRP